MTPGATSLIIQACLTVALVVAAYGDIRARIIPNRLNILIAAAAPLWWWASGLSPWPDVAVQLALATGVLLVFAGLFAFGAMGGGDVKLLAALALWFPPMGMIRLLVVMALAGGVVTLVTLIIHRTRAKPGSPEIPYGVAISFAAIWIIANDVLTRAG